jgi:hypothetical protein
MGCPLVRRISVPAIAATLAVVAVFAATAAASEPHAGHWSGAGVHFQVEHDGSHIRVLDIRWQDRTSFAPDWVYHGEFSSCWSSSGWTGYSIRTCFDGKFISSTEATGTVRSFFVASDGWGHTAQRERSREDWTASHHHPG